MSSRQAVVAVALLAASCARRPALAPSASPEPDVNGSARSALPAAASPEAPGEVALDDSGDNDAESDANDERVDDGEVAEPATGSTVPHPLDGWSDERIERAVTSDLPSLGPMSVGTPNAGALVNGVQAVASPLYSLVSPGSAWGTQETIDYLNTAVRAVHAEFPDTPALALGDIGARHGGPLKPHISHQAGRDLDISFYYEDGTRWYARGTP